MLVYLTKEVLIGTGNEETGAGKLRQVELLDTLLSLSKYEYLYRFELDSVSKLTLSHVRLYS